MPLIIKDDALDAQIAGDEANNTDVIQDDATDAPIITDGIFDAKIVADDANVADTIHDDATDAPITRMSPVMLIR